MSRSSATIAGSPSARVAAVTGSARWAAWGDALGFPTEFARDESDVERRMGVNRVEKTVPWRRRIGGRMGVEVELPAGMYSDDTQLRLAVARCIRASGRFDIEVFSKIELPVLLSYGFGVGRGTRAAGQSLSKRTVRWYSNFFSSRSGAQYTQGGGNGAAMRIQPHVWAAPSFDPDAFLPTVVRDTITTHGHMRGIIGAAYHALTLAATLQANATPPPSEWLDFAAELLRVPAVIEADEALAERWLPLWERESGMKLRAAINTGLTELGEAIELARSATRTAGDAESRYARLASDLGALNPSSRGSGTTSAVLALYAAYSADGSASQAVTMVANLLGSDTDTVASMSGALAGGVSDEALPGPLVDEALIVTEAERLALLPTDGSRASFPHPDPLRWQPPKTQADALGTLDGQVVLAGLGPARIIGDVITAPDGGHWQWIELEFGQTALVKRREDLPKLGVFAAPQPRLIAVDQPSLLPPDDITTAVDEESGTARAELARLDAERTAQEGRNQDRVAADRVANRNGADLPDDVEEGVALLRKSRFELYLMSRLLMHYARQEHGTTKAAIFAALVAEAIREQDARRRGRRS